MKTFHRSAILGLAVLVFASLSFGSTPKLGLSDFGIGAQYFNANLGYDTPSRSGFGIYSALNCSLLDLLLNSGNIFPARKTFPLRIGDLLGANIAGDFSPLFVDLRVLYGAQALYAVTDQIDVGIKFYHEIRSYFYKADDSPIALVLNTPGVTVRFGSLVGAAAFGFGTKKGTAPAGVESNGEDYSSMTYDARYLLHVSSFLGLRADFSTNKFVGSGRKDNDLMLTLQYGYSI